MPTGNRERALAGRVAVVTGAGGGIGSEVALELSRRGAAVVAVDSGVGVEGEPLDEPTAARTAESIESEGGSAIAATTSVTDATAIRSLFEETVATLGSLDVVVNAAGILRFPTLADTIEDDWRAVLDVHFEGYRNVLAAALPIMADAGYGRIVGVTSGVGLGLTSPDGPAYGSAKRAVAALTWELGAAVPVGVTVNALAPMAATRMIEAALVAGGANAAGLDLSGMPQPAEMAPLVAYLCGEEAGWCRGQVISCAGSELSVMRPPVLLEAVGTRGVDDLAGALSTLMPVVLGPAEGRQRTTGGGSPRFGRILSPPDAAAHPRSGGRR